jgi:DNA-binding transcriptional MocR family regulator
MVKGIGLNGLRIAFAMHPAKWRGAFEDALETAGASLDRFSLANARKFAAEPKLFSSLLMAAREQVEQSQKAADVVMTGTPVTATRVQNGYMGTLMVDLSTFAGSYADNRSALLNACRAHRLPIVLKASAGFAADETWEGVRMNYFTSRDNAVKSAEVLVKAVFAARDATR